MNRYRIVIEIAEEDMEGVDKQELLDNLDALVYKHTATVDFSRTTYVVRSWADYEGSNCR